MRKLIINSKRFRFIRVFRDLSLDDVAKKMGLSKQSLCRYENGEASPKIETLEKMAEVYDVPISFLTEPKVFIRLGFNEAVDAVIDDEIQFKNVSFKIERVYGQVERGDISLSKARLLTRQLILESLMSNFR